MNRNILDYIKSNITYLDGGMGTLLQAEGLRAGEHPERWNLTHPDKVRAIHKAYFDGGSNVVSANTFGANILKFEREELREIISAALENVRVAMKESSGGQEKFAALDIGPTGRLLAPLGDLDFEDAVAVFAETVKIGAECGADLVIIETMNDSYETKAALLAAKENCNLPVFVMNAYGKDGKLMTGADPETMVAILEGMGADAIGLNCSLGPRDLEGVVEKLLASASVPVIVKPNAGLPRSENGKTVFDVPPADFAAKMAEFVAGGARIVGGCCGTTPEYIKELTRATKGLSPKPITDKNTTTVSSYSRAVTFGSAPVLIGERINPTGKKRFKQALVENDMDYILREGINQEEKGVHILDVNVGIPDIDEALVLERAVCELQAVTALPLQIDTGDAAAMERALRRYNGKALINSVNGKEESMSAIFPLMKKYGGVCVALTLDEKGIPATAEGRVAIAERILKRAEEYGINKKNIIFDTLAMTISSDTGAAMTTLSALDEIKHRLGCPTSLGVSNISFGLPARDAVNSTFFACALERGLSAAIMNPYSADMMRTYYTYRALHGMDESCAEYIAHSGEFCSVGGTGSAVAASPASAEGLSDAIVKGMKNSAAEETKKLLDKGEMPLDVVKNEIIPALDTVGKGFENKTVYLPQLLTAAEAAKEAFEVIKSRMAEGKSEKTAKCAVVIATVKGDIHDIGKNIVKLLLENYGFDVYDLGKDVPPEKIVEETLCRRAPVVALSALMTTTVPAMEETVKLLREKAPFCKIMVGGAVLTEEYAARIGADAYGKDAMEAVRYAERVNSELECK